MPKQVKVKKRQVNHQTTDHDQSKYAKKKIAQGRGVYSPNSPYKMQFVNQSSKPITGRLIER